MSTRARPYASGTSVSITRSKEQIETELRRLGAQRRAFYDDDEQGRAVVAFERANIRYTILLPLPDPQDPKYRHTPVRGYARDDEQTRQAWEQDTRERWRALAEHIKAVRIAAEAGIIRIEQALLAHVTLPNGQTVGQWAEEQLPEIARSGTMPPFLPGYSEPRHLLRLPEQQETKNGF